MTDRSGGDRIELRGLRLTGFCGVLPEEQERRQPLEVDIDLEVDLAAAAATDSLGDTVDYGAICDAVDGVVATERFALLERLAGRLADACLADERIGAVEVSVRKLRPPVAQQLATSGVRIRRTRR